MKKPQDGLWLSENILLCNTKILIDSWATFLQEKPVLQNVVSGVIVSTKSLVLQKITRDHGGDYSCRATNALGETASEASHLSIQCKSLLKRVVVTRVGKRHVAGTTESQV